MRRHMPLFRGTSPSTRTRPSIARRPRSPPSFLILVLLYAIATSWPRARHSSTTESKNRRYSAESQTNSTFIARSPDACERDAPASGHSTAAEKPHAETSMCEAVDTELKRHVAGKTRGRLVASRPYTCRGGAGYRPLTYKRGVQKWETNAHTSTTTLKRRI